MLSSLSPLHDLVMLLLPFLLSVFSSSFPLLASSKTVQGDNFCSDLMCVTAFVNSSTITYQMTALNQLGWIAMGFGTQMADAKMVIMWPNTDGTVTISQRTAPGLVEPVPDPNPPRNASLYMPLTNLSPNAMPSLAFIVPKGSTVNQSAIWALGVSNPLSSAPDANLELHLDSGAFALNLSNSIDTEDIPALNPSSSISDPASPTSPTVSGSPLPSNVPSDETQPFEFFEKLIVAHAVLCVTGLLVVLPAGALIARWGRTFTDNWFYYHWMTQVVLSIPVVVTGWALGPLSVAVQGGGHVNDSHKVLGILLFPLYLIQLMLGTFIHLRKPVYPKRHPPRNIVHGVLGLLIVGLAFYQVRTGITVDWTAATDRSINLDIFSNLWISWIVFIPLIYSIGFCLVPRQLAYERELPPPYSPRSSDHEENHATGVRHLLGLEPVDDGTHDFFSEDSTRRRSSRGRETNNTDSGGIEMREVETVHRTPLSIASSRLASASGQ